jgi:uncharacterized protein involved in cysteine biosynthesis
MTTVFAWLADLGIQLDDYPTDDRQLAYRAALREARRAARTTSSPFARLATRFGLAPTRPTVKLAPCACAA